jgi:hypothetical protein
LNNRELSREQRGGDCFICKAVTGCDQLTLDDQGMLADVLHRRVVAQRRGQLITEVREAEEEYRKGV